jgi:hypothetical protein
MKLTFKGNTLTITREETDKKYYGTLNGAGESKLLHDVKNELNKQGYDLIKKIMWKDGHMVDDMQQYLRTRKKGAGKADIYIYSGFWAIRGANDDFNNGEVVLNVEYDVFNEGQKDLIIPELKTA